MDPYPRAIGAVAVVVARRFLQSTTTTAANGNDNGGEERVKGVVLLILAFVAIILAFAAVSYLAALGVDLCSRSASNNSTATTPNNPASLQPPPYNATDGGQWSVGLKVSERQAILQQLLAATTFRYGMPKDNETTQTTTKNCGGQQRGGENTIVDDDDDDDIEMATTIKSHPEREGCDKAFGQLSRSNSNNNELEPTKRFNPSRTDMEVDKATAEPTENADAVAGNMDAESDWQKVCGICLSEYEPGESVTTGTQCNHLFHTECCQTWLLSRLSQPPHGRSGGSSSNHHCPYCRQELFSAAELRHVAMTVLGEERVEEIRQGEPASGRGMVGEGSAFPWWWTRRGASGTFTTGSSTRPGTTEYASNTSAVVVTVEETESTTVTTPLAA